jgi:glycine dehydrogenase subunit 1
MLGRRGFEQVGRLCLGKAEYLKQKIVSTGRFETVTTAPTFNEFAVRRKDGKAAPLLAALAAKGILGGIDLGAWFPDRDDQILVAVTERHDRAALDRFAATLAAI